MIVGIDVHKHNHAAALIDDRGGEIATLTIANAPKARRALCQARGGHGGSPTKTSQGTVSEILALRKQLSKDGFDAGAQTIHTHLERKHEQVPSAATIWRLLKAQAS